MKKMAALFFLFAFFICIPKSTTQSVFAEKEDKLLQNTFSYYTVSTSGKITTQNFINYFKDTQIISIKPYLNMAYKQMLQSELNSFVFSDSTIENNLYFFSKKYEKIMQKHGLKKELASTYITGIPLESVTIFCTENSYYTVLKELKKL